MEAGKTGFGACSRVDLGEFGIYIMEFPKVDIYNTALFFFYKCVSVQQMRKKYLIEERNFFYPFIFAGTMKS